MGKIVNLLDNKEFEYLMIIFRDLMDVKIPRKYVYELKFIGEPDIVTQHFENSYPEKKPVNVDFITLNDVTMSVNRNYCANLYSINGSDEFSPVKERL